MGESSLDIDQILDSPDERWPSSQDRLLTPGWDTFLAEDAPERSFRLLRGYKRAGDVLIRQALTNRSDCNNLIFPALFNYRHYIELVLKAAIEEHGPLVGARLGSKGHRLPDLWKLFVQIAVEFNFDLTDPAAQAVGRCIDEFAEIDPNSTTLRYAKTLRGDVPSLPSGLDLVRLHDVMSGIENFFECADHVFSYKADCAAEESRGYD